MERPITVLIGALGGEGGGVLTGWLVQAAMGAGLPVQSTSIPGVAQRTGATTYYLEIFPRPITGVEPVMGLYPSPGDVDVMIASELLEAGRALEMGFVSPDRTILIASTHRIYAVAEKAQMGDGRFDASRIVAAARELAAEPILHDFAAIARARGAPVNALLLGVLARTGALPIDQSHFEAAIENGGIAVESNLRGFRAGLTARENPPAEIATRDTPVAASQSAQRYPPEVRDLISQAADRVLDYQGPDYLRTFYARLDRVHEQDIARDGARHDYMLTRETARYLALWMSYEDVPRVAELKSRPSRMQRVRETARAMAHEPVRVTEFFKPGIDEICAALPRRLAGPLRWWTKQRPGRLKRQFSMRVRTDRISGHLVLRAVALLGRWRTSSERFAVEQAHIERWLLAVQEAASKDYQLALEVVECANLNKGYGETFARGRGNFIDIMDRVVAPALAAPEVTDAAARVRAARAAALSDPEGQALGQVLVAPPVAPRRNGVQLGGN